jgi:putative ABC transport system permease protein
MVAPLENATPLGITVGSKLTYRVAGQTYVLEIIGLTSQAFGFSGNGPTIPPDVLAAAPDFRLYTLQVEKEHVNEALVSLSTIRIPPTFSLDVTFIDSLIGRLITQFAAIPTIVGLLSLLAAAVIMANTVALGTLERRRQIGILKSVGLKSRRVLVIMLIETTLIGLLSAALGIGLSSIFITVFTGLLGTPIPLPRDARLVALALVIAAILIGWLATFLSAGVAVRERVMNVLRYE